MKLNLGCGDKILPGYVNVDAAPSRAGRTPDVLCDLHKLIFDDGSADEILSVHVVEHFWRWEVVDVLREWARVLKPGAPMILECPNLQSACEQFLRDPEAFSGPGQEGQRTMWVFYGDPAWRDPLMVHRWGYTPRSLAGVMAEAGLGYPPGTRPVQATGAPGHATGRHQKIRGRLWACPSGQPDGFGGGGGTNRAAATQQSYGFAAAFRIRRDRKTPLQIQQKWPMRFRS